MAPLAATVLAADLPVGEGVPEGPEGEPLPETGAEGLGVVGVPEGAGVPETGAPVLLAGPPVAGGTDAEDPVADSGAAKATAAKARTRIAVNFMLVRVFGVWGLGVGLSGFGFVKGVDVEDNCVGDEDKKKKEKRESGPGFIERLKV
jgi:hypothetical protein